MTLTPLWKVELNNQTNLNLLNYSIDVWHLSDHQICHPYTLNQLKKTLCDEEWQRYQSFHFEKHRKQFLLARAFLRALLTHYVPTTAPSDWVFVKNEYGKPSLCSQTHSESKTLYFNVSHTEDKVLLAFTSIAEIGIDIEQEQEQEQYFDLASKYFTNEEVDQLSTIKNRSQKDAFFDFWTLKEAYIKAVGQGMSIPLDSFSITLSQDDDSAIIDIKGAGFIENNLWKLWRLPSFKGYKAAIAIHTPLTIKMDNLNIKEINAKPFNLKNDAEEQLLIC